MTHKEMKKNNMGIYKLSIDIMTDLLMEQIEEYVETALQYGKNSNELKDLEHEQQFQFDVTTDFLGMLMEAEIKNTVCGIK